MGDGDGQDDVYLYQCKQCDEKFKTTIALQKHKRLNHRATVTATSSSSSLSSVSAGKPPLQPLNSPKTDSGNNNEKKDAEELGLNRVPTEQIISTPSGRHLSCNYCRYKFDTKDPVVVHLLKLSRRQYNGSLKCPFCVKVQLEEVSADATEGQNEGKVKKVSENSGSSWNLSTTSARRDISLSQISRSTPRRSTTISRSSFSSLVGKKKVNQDRKQSLDKNTRPIKRSFHEISMNELKLKRSETGTPIVSPNPITTISSVSTPLAVLSSSSSFNSSSMLPLSNSGASVSSRTEMETDSSSDSVSSFLSNSKLDYEVMPKRSHTRKSMSRLSSSNDTNEAPRTLPVLINKNPISGGSRLPVPKSKDFKNGSEFRCQYCSFVAKSLRPLQFHINTHMEKSYPCKLCPKIYRSKQYLWKHTEKHHASQMNSNYQEKEIAGASSTLSQNYMSNDLTSSTVCGSEDNPDQSHDGSLSDMDCASASGTVTRSGTQNLQLSPAKQVLREFFMFAQENVTKPVENVVKLENF